MSEFLSRLDGVRDNRNGTGPKYVRISKNIIKCRAGAIREFIRSREFGSTSEESQGGDV